MILKQGHEYYPMPHDGKVIRRIYRGGRCYYDSPYSPEATQALKAAFPQYWTAIRDYGYAHPQLVPFINEDPMLIVSLVEVGKVRYIESLGNACFDLGVENHSDQVTYECEWYESRNANRWTVFGSTGASTNPGKWSGVWYHPSNTEIYSATGNTDGVMRNGYTVDGWNLLLATYTNGSATATLNGHSLSGTYSGSVQNNRSISLFGGKFGYNDIREIAPSGIRVTYWKKTESGHNHWFVPYRKPSGDSYTVELLDLETGNLATRVGTFTIEITDKE